MKKRSYTKIALALSVLLLILWGVLGTGTTLAWFTDTTPSHTNTFYIGDMDLDLFYKTPSGYQPVGEDTAVFDEDALYEPGYVQIVYLKVKNSGNVPFEYKFSVDVNNVTLGENALGGDIYLPNYLKYGVLFGADEETLTRDTANLMAAENFPEQAAAYPLNVYSEKDTVVPPNGERFIALIVRMPQDIGNAANYRGDVIPTVELGLTVTASQEGTLS